MRFFLSLLTLVGCFNTSLYREKHDELGKAENDAREYRYLELANRMKIVLIKDENANKNTAFLSILGGLVNDPLDMLGLSHFLEHCVLLGSENYPEENRYRSFIATNGGRGKATTYLDRVRVANFEKIYLS